MGSTRLSVWVVLCSFIFFAQANRLQGYHHPCAVSGGSDSTTAYRDRDITIVTGTVIDRSTGKPMPGVNIFVQGTSRGTQSDKTGFYSLRAPSQSMLTVSHVGYLTERMPVGLGGNLDIAMKKGMYKIPLPEVSGAYYATTPPVSAPRRYIRTEKGGYMILEQMPNFAYGGYAGLALYLRQAAAQIAARLGQTGRVNIGFTVTKNADVTGLHVIQSDNALLNREAMSIVQEIKGWIPGMQCGMPVDVRVSMSINFDKP